MSGKTDQSGSLAGRGGAEKAGLESPPSPQHRAPAESSSICQHCPVPLPVLSRALCPVLHVALCPVPLPARRPVLHVALCPVPLPARRPVPCPARRPVPRPVLPYAPPCTALCPSLHVAGRGTLYTDAHYTVHTIHRCVWQNHIIQMSDWCAWQSQSHHDSYVWQSHHTDVSDIVTVTPCICAWNTHNTLCEYFTDISDRVTIKLCEFLLSRIYLTESQSHYASVSQIDLTESESHYASVRFVWQSWSHCKSVRQMCL